MKALNLSMGIIGAALCLDTLLLLPRSNMNLGVLLPLIYGLPMLVFSLFSAPLSALWASRAGTVIKYLLIAAYALSFIFFLTVSLFLRTRGNQKASDGADALLVLGCGLRWDRPSLVLRYRLDAAYEYLKDNPDTVCFVSGGQGAGEAVPEARAMRDYLLDKGIDGERIVAEEKSMSTYENFSFSFPMIRERFGEDANIVYLTTRFHVYRAGRVASAQNISAYGMGAKDVWYLCVNNYLRECVAVTVYILRGQI